MKRSITFFRVNSMFLFLLIIPIWPLALSACSSSFDGSRTGNESQFIMDYSMLNKTDSQDLSLDAGDVIHAEIVVDGGSLSIRIQKSGDEPIYESDGIFFSQEFDVEAEESGTYTVTVTGEKAKGSVSFVKVIGAEE